MKTGNKVSAEQILLMKEKHDKKTNRVTKLHNNFTKMICFAAASDNSTVDNELPESAKSFFNAESAGKAEQELINQFAKLKMKRVAFASGTAKSLYKGRPTYLGHRHLPNEPLHLHVLEAGVLRAIHEGQIFSIACIGEIGQGFVN